jgi:hypothetical protein
MSNVTLGLKIDEALREISALQAKIDQHVKYFDGLQMRYYHRDDVANTGHERRYDEMVFSERKLALAQRRLASLLLELTTESINRLDSSVKTLDSSVGSLSSLTRRLVKSSKLLEYLTAILIITTLVTISISILSWNPYYALLTLSAESVALIVIWRRAKRELPKI